MHKYIVFRADMIQGTQNKASKVGAIICKFEIDALFIYATFLFFKNCIHISKYENIPSLMATFCDFDRKWPANKNSTFKHSVTCNEQ